jgi:hypothetical protein
MWLRSRIVETIVALDSTNLFPFLPAPGADDDGTRFSIHIVVLTRDSHQWQGQGQLQY